MLGWEEPESRTVQVLEPKAQGLGARVHSGEAVPIWNCDELAREGSPSYTSTARRRFTED